MVRQEDDVHWKSLRAAIRLATEARGAGDHPFGAVLVVKGDIVLTAPNTVRSSRDVTAHAELNLLRQLDRLGDAWDREGAILYASTEPCVMCAGAIYWSGIRTVVYGCSAATLATFATGSFTVPCREVLAKGRHSTTVIGPLLEDEAKVAHLGFWRS